MACGATVLLIADRLGAKVQEIRGSLDRRLTDREIEVAFGTIKAGKCGAVCTRAAGVVEGREAIVIEHVIRMARDVAPDWLNSEYDAPYRVDIEGDPDIHYAMTLGHAEGYGAGPWRDGGHRDARRQHRAHLVSVCADSFWTFQGMAVRRASLARAMDELARRRAQLPATEIAAALRRYADRRISPPVFGPLDPLADVLVHRGDMSIPLGLTFSPNPERAALALDFLTTLWRFGFVPLGFPIGIRPSPVLSIDLGGAERQSGGR